MCMTDPIADMLTRIRNANAIGRKKVDVPFSKIKKGILEVLKREGFIEKFEEVEGRVSRRRRKKRGKVLRVFLKYGENGEFVINQIRRESKCGRRVYRSVKEIKKVLNGYGIGIYSTPKGILSDRECRLQKVGGEYLCSVF
ncbi:MAG: 30S ribosomal protein S8 [Planctomycetota bacterium]|nr:MAG: 30S ribosomal protein S8 [Planctomycetota bacterium]